MESDAPSPSLADFDWEHLGVQLLERERRPVVVIDFAGRVVRTNRAFLFLLADGARTHQVSFRDEWLEPAARAAFDDALKRASAGEQVQVTVGLTNTLYPLDLVLELVRLGLDPARGVMAVMVDAVSREPSMPLRPAVGFSYEVPVSGQGPRVVSRKLSSELGPPRGGGAGKPCWSEIFGRDAECSACPVRHLEPGARASAVVDSTSGVFLPTLLVAERRGEHAVVTAVPIDDKAYEGLVRARLHHLASAAKLTPREVEMVTLLLLGRSIEDLAAATGLTPRTAKYHQQKLLKKLGAESRVDLARLLL